MATVGSGALVPLAVFFGPAGCAVPGVVDRADADAGPEGGAGKNPGGSGGGAGSGAGASGGGAIWTPSSTAIDVGWCEYFGATMHYGKTRAELTDEELALIDEIRQDPVDTGCVSDGSWATVTITTDGVDTAYRARVGNALCGTTEGYVGYSAVWALLQAAGCETHFVAGATLAEAPSIRSDSGCYYPLRGAGPRGWWVHVDVTDPGSLRFSFDDCAGVDPSTATLFDEEGVTELATTTASPGECPNLTVDVAEPGTYALYVVSETAAALGSSSFTLHIERADFAWR